MSLTKNPTKQKQTGSHNTPEQLADFLAKKMIQYIDINKLEVIRVLDPACGEGELLLAIAKNLKSEYLQKVILIGIETNELTLKKAEKRLNEINVKELKLIQGDFIDISQNNSLKNEVIADIIIANPPYVRTQILGSKQTKELAKIFGLKGYVDLYHVFLIAMTNYLVPNGILGVITSNRFLFVKSGELVRNFLSDNYQILDLLDLGDTKLFEAAVLPAILIGRKENNYLKFFNSNQKVTNFLKIYEINQKASQTTAKNHCNSIYEILENNEQGEYLINNKIYQVSTGLIDFQTPEDDQWLMINKKESNWLETIDNKTYLKIDDLAKVRVGIKTTADHVFIRKTWTDLPVEIQPESELLSNITCHENANKWIAKPDEPYQKILYTHQIIKGKKQAIDLSLYPKTAAYFEKYRDKLEGRQYVIKAKRNWYEIWVPQDPLGWQKDKIVFPDISPEPKFFYDRKGSIINGDCYWITLNKEEDQDLLFLILGVANSQLMTRYHDLKFNNKLYSGRRRYLTQYVKNYPLPNPNLEESKRVTNLVKELIFNSLTDKQIKEKENEIEALIASAFGINSVVFKD